MKLFVTVLEIDSAVYAEVDLAENKTPEEIRTRHVAKYMASGLWESTADVIGIMCAATTVEATASFWKGDDVQAVSPGALLGAFRQD
jgi:hypothetical protein